MNGVKLTFTVKTQYVQCEHMYSEIDSTLNFTDRNEYSRVKK